LALRETLGIDMDELAIESASLALLGSGVETYFFR
jgi:hypothetical protein